MSRFAEQQGFTCQVFFDESKLVVASWAKGDEPGSGSVLAGYWVVFDQPSDLLEVVAAVRRAWWMTGTGTFASDEQSEAQLAIETLFGVEYHGEVASVRMILATHVGDVRVGEVVVAETRVVPSVWKQGQRQLANEAACSLPFDADDASIADALAVAMTASTAGSIRG